MELFNNNASMRHYGTELYVKYKGKYDHMDDYLFFGNADRMKFDVLSQHGIDVKISDMAYQGSRIQSAWYVENGKTTMLPKNEVEIMEFVNSKLKELAQ